MTVGTRHGTTLPSGSGLVGLEGSVTAHGGHVYGTVRGKGRASETPVMSLRKLSPREGDYLTLTLFPPTHTRSASPGAFPTGQPRGGGTDTWPLGALGGGQILGPWSAPAPQRPGRTYGSVFPSPGLGAASAVPARATSQTMTSGLGFSRAQESSCGLPGSHPQPAEGWGPKPLARGGGGAALVPLPGGRPVGPLSWES